MGVLIITIGIVSGIASIIGLLLSIAKLEGKKVHMIYGFFVALISSVLVTNVSSSQKENQILEQKINLITSIGYEATELLKNTSRSNDGERRGFIFASLAFLEKHKDKVPDSYKLAKQFAIGSKVLDNQQESGPERLYQTWRLKDASDAMESLLKGLSVNKENKFNDL